MPTGFRPSEYVYLPTNMCDSGSGELFVAATGEIRKTGKNPILFTLPPKFRPATNVDLHVNMCTGSLGQLSTTPKGVVREHPEENLTFAPRCGISLDGASFALSSQSFAPLKLTNGWKTAKGTAAAAIRLRSGFVQFRGAISSTSGTPSRSSSRRPVPHLPGRHLVRPLTPGLRSMAGLS